MYAKATRARESKAPDDSKRFTSLEAEFAEILHGIEIPKFKESVESPSPSVSFTRTRRPPDSPLDSTYGDSLDLSAADFEVGAYAAKRVHEKAAERGRRMSFDAPTFMSQKDASFLNTKNSASPDVKGRRSSIPEGFQMSTALSSIHRSRASGVDPHKEGKRFSLERSEDDIYKMLNVTNGADSEEKFSKLSTLDKDSSEGRLMRSVSEQDYRRRPLDSFEEKLRESDEDHDEDFYEELSEEGSPIAAHRLRGAPQPATSKAITTAAAAASSAVSSALHRVEKEEEEEDNYEDEDEYYDDFEENNLSLSRDVRPTAAAAAAALLPPRPQPAPTPAPAPAVSGFSSLGTGTGELTAVEQIMQRWANTDTQQIAMSILGTATSDEDDRMLKQGLLPKRVETPEKERVSSANKRVSPAESPQSEREEREKETHLDAEEKEEKDRYKEKESDEERYTDEEEEKERERERDRDTEREPVLLSAVGENALVTSFPSPALLIPTWSAPVPVPVSDTGTATMAGPATAVEEKKERESHDTSSPSSSSPSYKSSFSSSSSLSSSARRYAQAHEPEEERKQETTDAHTKREREEEESELISCALLPSRSSRYPQTDSEPRQIAKEDRIVPEREKEKEKEKKVRQKTSQSVSVSLSKAEREKEKDKEREASTQQREKVKLSATTALRLKQKQQKRGEKEKVEEKEKEKEKKRLTRRSTTPTALPASRSLSREKERDRERDRENDALLDKLLRDNTRLSRRFNALEQELHDVRRSGSRERDRERDRESLTGTHMYVDRERARVPSRRITPFIDEKKSLLLESRESVREREREEGEARVLAQSVTRALQHIQNQPSSALNNTATQRELQAVVQKLLEQSYQLQDRERALLLREQALAVRESVVNAREADRPLPSDDAFAEIKEKWLRCEKEKSALQEELQAAREKNVRLTLEVDAVKSELLRTQENVATDKESDARVSMGLTAHVDVLQTMRPLEKILNDLHTQRQAQQWQQRRANKTNSNNNGKNGNNKAQKEEEAPNEGEQETVAVNKREFENLVRDCATQERLIAGFQKENERVMRLLREKESEEQAKQARYLDEKEALNKEINRLRNIHRVFTNNAPIHDDNIDNNVGERDVDANHEMRRVVFSSQYKTAEQLKLELEMDAKLRDLNEKYALLSKEKGEQERKYLAQVDTLQREIAALRADNAGLRDKSMEQLERDMHALQQENVRLKEKVRWFAENQQLIDESHREAHTQKQLVRFLTAELAKKGVSPQTIKTITQRFHAKGGDGMNDSDAVAEPAVEATHAKSTRSFADIKRIRELENTVRDLREAISKRFPDSVASLIHATKVEDVQQERQVRALQAQISSLQEELQDVQSSHDKKIRSLRVEHERVKAHYESLLKEMSDKLKATRPAHSPRKTATHGEDEDQPDSLPAALQRIASLKNEIEKIRMFYTRKLEEQQRKFDAQLRQWKRGERETEREDVPPPPPPSSPPQTLAPTHTQTQAMQGSLTRTYTQAEVSEVLAVYKDRLGLLEAELMRTAEELGRVRAAHAQTLAQMNSQAFAQMNTQPSTQPHTQTSVLPVEDVQKFVAAAVAAAVPPAVSVVSREEVDRIIAQHMKTLSAQLESKRQEEIRSLQNDYERRVSEILAQTQTQSHSQTNAQAQTQQWCVEREQYLREIADERSKCASLVQELIFLKQARQTEAKNPSLVQLQMMEAQLKDVEQRLARRDRELSAAMEEFKASAKLERARLETIHAQELREKDEQLNQFQFELQKLLEEFHRLQNFQSSTYEFPSTDAGRVSIV